MTEYLVVDYDTGAPPNQVEADLNGYGASGWEVRSIDLTKSNKRRVIFTKASTVYAPEAPADGVTYGRKDLNWNPVLPLSGGTMNGAIVLPGNPINALEVTPKQYVDASIADLNDVYMRWVPYTGPPQSFLNQDCTRDGDWTMIALRNTSDRPAPQQSGPEEDLLPPWIPTTQNIRATYTMYNEWTVNTTGWIDKYGGTVLAQNVNALHTITLNVNGVVKDTFTSTPANPIMYWHDITPILVPSGAVVRVTVKVNQVANNLMYWNEQPGLFATAPTYCSLAVGSMNGAAASSTAYDTHVQFIPGTMSPDWDVVAFGGSAGGGGAAAVGTTIETTPVTVANLPAVKAGLRAFVTDAMTAVFNDIVAGGGTNGMPVFSDGTNWKIG
jgi:hypothetical protein